MSPAIPVINVVVLLKRTLGSLDQFRNAGAKMITHLGVLRVRRVVILKRLTLKCLLDEHFQKVHLIKAAHVIFGAGDDALLLLLNEGDHPDDVLLANVAVGIRLLHEAVAGLIEEALRRLPVLGRGGVEEVVEAFLTGLAFSPALGVTLYEKVDIDEVSILQRTLLRRCPDCCSVNHNNDTENQENAGFTHFLQVKASKS